jgi:hypothetical protein
MIDPRRSLANKNTTQSTIYQPPKAPKPKDPLRDGSLFSANRYSSLRNPSPMPQFHRTPTPLPYHPSFQQQQQQSNTRFTTSPHPLFSRTSLAPHNGNSSIMTTPKPLFEMRDMHSYHEASLSNNNYHIVHPVDAHHNLNRITKVDVQQPKDMMEEGKVLSQWYCRFPSLLSLISDDVINDDDQLVMYGVTESEEGWRSSNIVERVTLCELKSCTGSIYRLEGQCNFEQMLDINKGLSSKFLAQFRHFIPENWKVLIEEERDRLNNLIPHDDSGMNHQERTISTYMNTTISQELEGADQLETENFEAETLKSTSPAQAESNEISSLDSDTAKESGEEESSTATSNMDIDSAVEERTNESEAVSDEAKEETDNENIGSSEENATLDNYSDGHDTEMGEKEIDRSEEKIIHSDEQMNISSDDNVNKSIAMEEEHMQESVGQQTTDENEQMEVTEKEDQTTHSGQSSENEQQHEEPDTVMDEHTEQTTQSESSANETPDKIPQETDTNQTNTDQLQLDIQTESHQIPESGNDNVIPPQQSEESTTENQLPVTGTMDDYVDDALAGSGGGFGEIDLMSYNADFHNFEEQQLMTDFVALDPLQMSDEIPLPMPLVTTTARDINPSSEQMLNLSGVVMIKQSPSDLDILQLEEKAEAFEIVVVPIIAPQRSGNNNRKQQSSIARSKQSVVEEPSDSSDDSKMSSDSDEEFDPRAPPRKRLWSKRSKSARSSTKRRLLDSPEKKPGKRTLLSSSRPHTDSPKKKTKKK